MHRGGSAAPHSQTVAPYPCDTLKVSPNIDICCPRERTPTSGEFLGYMLSPAQHRLPQGSKLSDTWSLPETLEDTNVGGGGQGREESGLTSRWTNGQMDGYLQSQLSLPP